MTDDFAIGIALSGGGVRAAVFHLGMLQRVADARQMERVTFISTVSGGSLCVGLIYASNGNRWPTSEHYLDHTLPVVRQILTERSIQRDAAFRALTAPHLLIHGRAKIISASIQRVWGISGLLKDVPTHPRWFINATPLRVGEELALHTAADG